MTVDWDYVKKTTLWPYEDLIEKLQDVLAYPFVQQYYDCSMPQAEEYARRLFADRDLDHGEYPRALLSVFRQLEAAGISNWSSLLAQINSRDSLLVFLEKNKLRFEDVTDVLMFLLRWELPFHTATRELLEHKDAQEMAFYEVLKQRKLTASFDLVEGGRTLLGRQALIEITRLPEDFITRIVHRADIARLPFVRRKTILPVCAAGYDTLKKIAAADLTQMEADLDTYLHQTKAKSWNNYRSVILLKGLVSGARALPVVLEETD